MPRKVHVAINKRGMAFQENDNRGMREPVPAEPNVL